MEYNKNIRYKPLNVFEYGDKIRQSTDKQRSWHKDHPGECAMEQLGYVCLAENDTLHYTDSLNVDGTFYATEISTRYMSELAKNMCIRIDKFFNHKKDTGDES